MPERRYTRAAVRAGAELLNEVAGRKLVSVSAYSPGDGATRYEMRWTGGPTQTAFGARDACEVIQGARYALNAYLAMTPSS